ncbi:Alanine dehydrogenase [Listeria innocua]|nr:Alanine dehydrogenase [Listeria innocua]
MLHYAVANMPGAVPRTSTLALTNATLPFGLKLANDGLEEAVKKDPYLLRGLNTYQGHITYKAVSDSLDLPYTNSAELI